MVSGLVDALWCADEFVFVLGSIDLKTLKALVRKIFCVGTFNLGLLVDDYKAWANRLFHKAASTQTIGQMEPLRCNNIFKMLDSIEYIKAIQDSGSDCSFINLQKLSHLVSSRQLPYMGLKTEIKSLEGFKDVVTSDYRPTLETLDLLTKAARRIGGICRSIRKDRPIPDAEAHISMTCSGEATTSIIDGGQACAVREGFERIMGRIAESDLLEDTPFGVASHREGYALWRTVFREEPVEGGSLYDPLYQGYPKDQPGRYLGLDRVLGKQLLYVAWKESILNPTIVLRASIVPEMGNKARVVTMSPYWVQLLQAPLAHLTIAGMRLHPSVFSSFARQDQAWEAAKGISRLNIDNWDDLHVLSSDLKDATNAQQQLLTRTMLRAFMNGYGMIHRNTYSELALSTIVERLITFEDQTSVWATTGIMMGEPIAKPSLTLLNLAIEELAFLTYTNRLDLLDSDLPSPYRAWRFIHIGGDDHLAIGPKKYLELITNYHLLAGSHIDPGKHGYSQVAVKYTERILSVKNFRFKAPFDYDNYPKSMIVDSVKVRLLERGQSTMQKKDNKNVAIGKSRMMSGCLDWLPSDPAYWPSDKKISIRNLFINRMGPLLPSKSLHPKCYHSVQLPSILGGFNLGLKSEIYQAYTLAPPPIRWVLNKAAAGVDVTAELKILSLLNRNISDRGTDPLQEYRASIIDQLYSYPQLIGAITWKEILSKFPPQNDNVRWSIYAAREAHYLSIEEFAEWSTRGNTFVQLIMGRGKNNVFNTRPYVRTFARVWTELEALQTDLYGDSPLGEGEFNKTLRGLSRCLYFDTSQSTTIDIGYYKPDDPDREEFEFVDATYLEAFDRMLPTLVVGKKFIGFRN
ncbi:RdRp [Wilkie narna-like virus 1]|nr:RdRp [Wilkie narna-like virus 1]